MFDLKKVVGVCDVKYPTIDFTTPWAEYNSYLECCRSLNVEPSNRRYFGYRNYLKSVGVI